MTVRLLVPAYGKQTNALYTGTTVAERALIDAGQADENLAASFDYPAFLAGKSMAYNEVVDSVARALSSPAAKASKILRAAAKGITPIAQVMASPPTITQAASDGANSTIIASSTIAAGGGAYNAENALHTTITGGPIVGGRIQTVTNGASRVAGHSNCVTFGTYSSVVDICIRANGSRLMFYVTDVLTGVRARVAATDIVATFSAANYYKLDFGSRALRIIEVYAGNVSNIYGINVPTTDSVWAVSVNQPRILIIGDSYPEGSMNDTTISSKLAYADFLAAGLGANNPVCNALGSTGVNANGATKTSFQGRLNAGDIDVSRIGSFDLVVLHNSINDASIPNGGTANDETFQAGLTSFVSALMTKQPDAIIVGYGPEDPPSGASTQARFDATKAGFLAAAGADSRMLYLDNSLAGEKWMFPGINTVIIGADNIHLGGVAGTSYLGQRAANSIIAALRTRFGA